MILTDGDISNPIDDKRAVCEASNYPIAITAVGVGDGPFNTLMEFDNLKSGRLFDNFHFIDFTKFESHSRPFERPDLVLATQVFNELPDQFTAMRKLGYL